MNKSNKILFHGTDVSFLPPFRNKHTWFALTYFYAYNHSLERDDPMVLKCKIDLEKVRLFDPKDFSHNEMLRKILPDFIPVKPYGLPLTELPRAFFLRMIYLFTNDTWRFMEHKLVTDKIKELGFHGHIAKENNEETICIYNPKCVEITRYIHQLTYEQHRKRNS